MKVVVTGASGHLGANLVRKLLECGHHVRAVSRYPNHAQALAGLPIEKISADVRDFDALCAAFEGCDVLYHLAAFTPVSADQNTTAASINVAGTENVARAALYSGIKRMLHVSSIHAFEQHPLSEPLDEKRNRVDPKSKYPAYNRSKAAGESAVRNLISEGLDAVILHPTGVIGPADFTPSLMGKILTAMRSNTLLGLVNGGFNWVDVRDVVDSLVVASEKGRCGESYILGGHWHSIEEIAEMVSAATGTKASPVTLPMWLARIAAPLISLLCKITNTEALYTTGFLSALRANHTILSSKAQHELGHKARPIQETISDLFQWSSENMPLDYPLLESRRVSP